MRGPYLEELQLKLKMHRMHEPDFPAGLPENFFIPEDMKKVVDLYHRTKGKARQRRRYLSKRLKISAETISQIIEYDAWSAKAHEIQEQIQIEIKALQLTSKKI